MRYFRVAACAIAAALVSCLGGAASAASNLSVALIWRVPAPQATSADVQPIEAGIVALGFIAPQLDALARHPGAKVTLALDPVFVDALQRAAQGSDALAGLGAGALRPSDPRTNELLESLATDVVPSVDLQSRKAASRFLAEAAEARLILMGSTAANFTHADDVDFVANALLLSMQSSGYASDEVDLLDRTTLSSEDLGAVSRDFATACQDVLQRLRQDARAGTVELAALPAYEPILPLVIDAAGRDQRVPFTVAFSASSDATAAIDEGLSAVASLDPTHGAAGVVSPSGAYDDETAALLQARHAAYAVFSERVVKASVGAAAAAVADARGAAYRAYLMETTKTATIPIFFCSDTASTAIDSQPLRSPATSMADRLRLAVRAALDATQGQGASVVVLCLPATGSILHRQDRAAALDAIAAALASGVERGTTPRDFLATDPPTAPTYGYEAASELGDFSLWMGSANQASMWNALDAARTAAGGDSAVANAATRDALLQAESGRWFLALALAQPQYLTNGALAQFRDLITRIYHSAGKDAPRTIAPVKLGTPSPAPLTTPAARPSPVPTASPSPAAGTSAPPGTPSPSPSPGPSHA
ncbi:MAG TPA: hypothetical protein VEJ41_01050 [Candidatus Acidoferrales bacterium]|nr:hypothetical protein [Candidatus Acidoferrales bacterium]